MGEIAEMMLDGILCEGCGVYMGDECGHSRRCRSCQRDAIPQPGKVACPTCGKRVKAIGLTQHMQGAHIKGARQ